MPNKSFIVLLSYEFRPLSSPYTTFNRVATNMPDRLTAANILKKWFFCRDVGGAGRSVVVEYL